MDPLEREDRWRPPLRAAPPPPELWRAISWSFARKFPKNVPETVSSIQFNLISFVHTFHSFFIMSRSRNFCFTLNNYSDANLEWWKQAVEMEFFKYVCFGQEIGDSLTPHLQGYVQLPKDRKSIKALIDSLANETCGKPHWEIARGSLEDNQNYTKKEGVWLEFGAPSCTGRGARSDLYEVATAISKGASLQEVVEDHPVEFIKYSGGLQKLVLFHMKPRNFKTTVLWYWGATGTGKSRTAWETYPAAYAKSAANKWWDGYLGQPVTILDDWRPTKEIPFNEMLSLMDRYPKTVESKGGTIHFVSKILIITCPLDPTSLLEGENYTWVGSEAKQQFLRRIDEIRKFGEDVAMLI